MLASTVPPKATEEKRDDKDTFLKKNPDEVFKVGIDISDRGFSGVDETPTERISKISYVQDIAD